MPRILIVDDHHAARTTLRELLDWHSFRVCGDAQNGKEAIEKVIELKPEIVLMDINMPVSRRNRNPSNRALDKDGVLDSP
jgi:YesN/AraC family two-component response regulator